MVTDWDPIGLKQRVTKAGRKYFRESKVTLSVQVPVIIKYRQSGYEKPTYLDWGEIVDEAGEVEELRNPPGGDHQALLLLKLQNRGQYSPDYPGKLLLPRWEDSDIFTWHHPTRPFLKKEKTWDAQGNISYADFPLQAATPLRHAFITAMPEAFESLSDGENCCVYQVLSLIHI